MMVRSRRKDKYEKWYVKKEESRAWEEERNDYFKLALAPKNRMGSDVSRHSSSSRHATTIRPARPCYSVVIVAPQCVLLVGIDWLLFIQ